MASDELKEMRKALTKEAIREHQMAKTSGSETDLFKCGKCKKKNCSYTQVRVLDKHCKQLMMGELLKSHPHKFMPFYMTRSFLGIRQTERCN